jgi:hypothetical protein
MAYGVLGPDIYNGFARFGLSAVPRGSRVLTAIYRYYQDSPTPGATRVHASTQDPYTAPPESLTGGWQVTPSQVYNDTGWIVRTLDSTAHQVMENANVRNRIFTALIRSFDTRGGARGYNSPTPPSIEVTYGPPYPREASVCAITSPGRWMLSVDKAFPAVVIANYGSLPVHIPVTLRVLSSTYHVQTSVFLTPAQVETLRFEPWYPPGAGIWTFRCSTALEADSMPFDDTLNFRTTVFVTRDAGTDRIWTPTGGMDTGTTVTPKASITNHGHLAATIPVVFTIEDNYYDTAELYLGSGSTGEVQFRQWTATRRGRFDVSCQTRLMGDEVPGNDVASDTLRVGPGVPDVGVTYLMWPRGTIDSGRRTAPTASVANFGPDSRRFPVVFSIEDGYTDSIEITLAAQCTTVVVFDTWQSLRVGTFSTYCRTCLTGDEVPGNDGQSDTVRVRPRVGLTAAHDPPDLGCGLRLWPNPARDVLHMQWTMDADLFAADGRAAIRLHPGSNDTRSLPAGVYFVRTDVPTRVLKVTLQR